MNRAEQPDPDWTRWPQNMEYRPTLTCAKYTDGTELMSLLAK